MKFWAKVLARPRERFNHFGKPSIKFKSVILNNPETAWSISIILKPINIINPFKSPSQAQVYKVPLVCAVSLNIGPVRFCFTIKSQTRPKKLSFFKSLSRNFFFKFRPLQQVFSLYKVCILMIYLLGPNMKPWKIHYWIIVYNINYMNMQPNLPIP